MKSSTERFRNRLDDIEGGEKMSELHKRTVKFIHSEEQNEK